MNLAEALNAAQLSIEQVLTQAGITNGNTKVGKPTSMCFYEMNAPTAESTNVKGYVVYSITGAAPVVYGDGEVLSRQVEVQINLYATNRKQDALISAIESAGTANSWKTFFSGIRHEASSGVYVFGFTLLKQIA